MSPDVLRNSFVLGPQWAISVKTNTGTKTRTLKNGFYTNSTSLFLGFLFQNACLLVLGLLGYSFNFLFCAVSYLLECLYCFLENVHNFMSNLRIKFFY